MKVSVSLPEADVEYLDAFAKETGLDSRSAAVHRAIRVLRTAELSKDYAAAWEEFAADPDAALWETTVGDGIE